MSAIDDEECKSCLGSNNLATLNHTNEYRDDRYDEKQMNEATHRGRSDHSERPEHEENDCDCPEHERNLVWASPLRTN
jgi:IS5 family transposase